MPIKKMIANIKEKKAVKTKAIKEAEQIFMKLNKGMAMKDGSFPKAKPGVTPKKYNKEARRVTKQVVGTRLKQMRAKRKISK